MSDRELLVYVDLAGVAHLVGRLWARRARNRESATFEYDADWLASPARFALESALMLGRGPQHTQQDRALFGAFGDSAPDRWGRNLIQRDERRRAQAEGRAPRSLGEVDFLLGVGDISRQGALRFKEAPDGPFLASDDGANIPPLIRLGELLNAAMRVAANGEDDGDLRLILAPGSSLGGARAKARVLSLAIDEADDTASLDVAFRMARQCGLKQPAAREIVGEVQAAVAQWRACAASYGLNARDMARMASAFEHEEAEGL